MQVVMETQDSQNVLLRRAQQGDRKAFEALLYPCREELGKYVAARLGDYLRSRVESDDVWQETCVRAWESLARVRWTGKDTFVRWLKGIARHVILKQVHHHRHDGLIYVQENPGSDETSPSRALRRGERFDRLQEALDSLPQDYREAVVLVRIEGLQIKEAARRMNRTPKAVMHLLARALKKLKETFGSTDSFRLPPLSLKPAENIEEFGHDGAS